ncbi:MAG: exodeoxyribonuclease V subunit gamma, partial [Pseudomonadales bacterium]
KDLARRSVRRLLGKDRETDTLTEEDYLDIGNPLLSSFGKQGREYLELLLEIDELSTDEAYTVPSGDSMLALIKRDILNLEFGGEFGLDARPEPRAIATDDFSLQIHACHSKMREIEVLYDQLLRIIDTDHDITPADIMVMTPDVGTYAPFIEAVFNREAGRNRLHYTIADRSLNQESAVLVAFSTLLGLPDARLTSTEVMDILEVPTIARKFNVFEEELLTLTHWVKDAGIRWELDGESKRVRWQVPASNQNTWQFGLDRLLLGLAMESGAGPFDGIAPMDLSASDGELLGTLCHFVELLAEYRLKLLEPRTMAEWRDILLAMLDDFFDPRGAEELDLGLIRELLIRLEGEIDDAAYNTPLSPNMLRYWFDQQLSISQQSRGFISGGITFATLVPMRSIPFKVVCLLGMNDGEYPRDDRPPTFDLMQSADYRKGDRSKRNDDRYLFLEALLSAGAFFYISYEGRSVKDNKERPPSVLVSELIDYVTRVFDHDPVTVHPLQPFSEEYYSTLRPDLVTYRNDWYDALLAPSPVQTFADVVFEDDPDLAADHISKLQQFFRHPARYFLRNRLGVYFEDNDIDLKDTESFTLDSLERYQLADSALTTLLVGDSIELWRQRAVASGLVMDGPLGRAQLDTQLSRAQEVYAEMANIVDVEAEWIQSTLYLPDKPGGLEGN